MISLLDKLAIRFPSVIFTKIIASSSIARFPPQDAPTIICYINGSKVAQFVQFKAFHGSSTTVDDIEWVLFKHGIVPSEMTEDPREAALFS